MTKAEIIHKGKVANLGCAMCNFLYGPHAPGPVELHHYRGGGWGKGDYKTLIPLCPEHHRGKTGVHGIGTKAFDNADTINAHLPEELELALNDRVTVDFNHALGPVVGQGAHAGAEAGGGDDGLAHCRTWGGHAGQSRAAAPRRLPASH